MSGQLFWIRQSTRTGDLCTAAGRVILPAVTLDAAGEEYLGETITVVNGSRNRTY